MEEKNTSPLSQENSYSTEDRYAGVLDRIKAIVIDAGLILASMFLISALISSIGGVTDSLRALSFLFIFFFYDPLFTAFLGSTLGQRIMGLRVKKESDESKNIHLALAFVRYLTKAALGWISLLTIAGNTRKRAIHDQISGSVVIYVKNLSNKV